MSDSNPTASFRFGRFVLQPGERRLLDDGIPVALEPRTLDLLIALVERAGRLVTKDELLERIWPGKIVEEANLHVHVSSLRKVLDGGAIATVTGHGYRFTESVLHVDVATFPPIAHPHNLPHPHDNFIGREDELLLLTQGLDRARLLTLTGIGGAGKTRLAIRLAECVAGSFPDGVCFVDLAPVAEGERVARAVAAALEMREEADKPIAETLIRHLAGRRRLLVLDNCEHLVEACAALTGRLLAAASPLRILVTSRERLDIAGEWVVPVRSLTMPPPASDADAKMLVGFESVRLFVERARPAAPGLRRGQGRLPERQQAGGCAQQEPANAL
jgi:DNA-binding winged helix-turn-helix (wHTH) protein